MNLLVWLILVASVNSNPAPEARRPRQSSQSTRSNRRELSDEDILKALTILLSEADGLDRRSGVDRPREGRQRETRERDREGRQGFEGVLGRCETTGFEVRQREECEEVTEIKCEKVNVTRFRNTIVNKCQTLFDQKCNVTYNDIPKQKCLPKQRKKCVTEYKVVEDKIYKEECKVDVQHVCEELIPVEVPYPVKKPYDKPPDPYPEKVLPSHQLHPPDHLGNAHNFDELIPLPEDSYLSKPPDLHVLPSQHGEQYEPPQPNSFHPPVTALPTILPHPTQLPPLFQAELEAAESHYHSSPSYSYDPTPGPNFLVSPTPGIFKTSNYQTSLEHEPKPNQYHGPSTSSPLALSLFNRPRIRLSRKKRNFVFPGSPSGPPGMARQSDTKSEENLIKEKLLKEIVKQLLVGVIEKNQELGSVNATIKRSRSINPINYHLNSLNLHNDPYTHPDHPYGHIKDHHHSLPIKPINDYPHNPLHDLPHDLLHKHFNPQHPPIHDLHDLHDLQHDHHPYHEPNSDLHHEPHIDPHHKPHHVLHHNTHQDPFHDPHHHIPHEPEYPPIITTHELPAPPGCRSIATKECHKIPVIVPKKVPYEVCNLVPDVDCVTVLKTVPELECTPEVLRECNDIEKKVPYLVPEDECVEVAFDECVTIEEKVPVELCKRKRLDEESITLSRGQVVRKEGEKRRTPSFRRGATGSTRGSSSSQSSSSSKSSSSSQSSQSSSSSSSSQQALSSTSSREKFDEENRG